MPRVLLIALTLRRQCHSCETLAHDFAISCRVAGPPVVLLLLLTAPRTSGWSCYPQATLHAVRPVEYRMRKRLVGAIASPATRDLLSSTSVSPTCALPEAGALLYCRISRGIASIAQQSHIQSTCSRTATNLSHLAWKDNIYPMPKVGTHHGPCRSCLSLYLCRASNLTPICL